MHPITLLARRATLCIVAGAAILIPCAAGAGDDPVIASKTVKLDGSSSMTIGRKLPTEWDTKVGADFSTTPFAATPDQQMQGMQDSTSGVAWMKMTLPGPGTSLGWDKTLLEARVDPLKEEGRLGTTFSRSVPINGSFALTLEDRYAVTQTLLPWHAGTASESAAQTLETAKALRLTIQPTGTTLSAATTINTVDGQWLNALSAEQKLFDGPLNVTGAVSETTSGELNRSISAGFKQAW